jgi:uncharacterized protein YqeY
MSLFNQIKKDMITALKSGYKEKSQTLKMLIATIKNAQIESEEDLTDKEIEKILRKETKKIQDSIQQYQDMGREDLVKKEKRDLAIVEEYLPELMTEEEVTKVVEKKIEELGANDMRDMGKIMGAVMKELEGKADGNTVKNIVQAKLVS